jgi:hypothetical protein
MTTPKQHWAEAVFEAFLELFGEVWPAIGPVIIIILLILCITHAVCLWERCAKGGDQ